MKLSIRASLRYPFATPDNQTRFWVMTLLDLIPGLGTFLLTPLATAAVSVITIERNETADLSHQEWFARTLRAVGASFLLILYFIPVLVGFGIIGFAIFRGEGVTWPALVLLLYGLVVASALPLAVLHAVTIGSVWGALELPKLVWLGFKIDLEAFLKIFLISIFLIFLKMTTLLFGVFGLGILLAPVRTYSEYVFHYLLAVSYVRAMPGKVK